MKISGPAWIASVDVLAKKTVITKDFPSRKEAMEFLNRNPGNASLFYLKEGREYSYQEVVTDEDMDEKFAAWDRQLKQYGSAE